MRSGPEFVRFGRLLLGVDHGFHNTRSQSIQRDLNGVSDFLGPFAMKALRPANLRGGDEVDRCQRTAQFLFELDLSKGWCSSG
jgi:hypothetical protein